MAKMILVLKLLVVAFYMSAGLLAFAAPAAAAGTRVLLPLNQKLVPGKEQLQISTTTQSSLKSMIKNGALNFSCNGVACACHGDLDCNDMFTTGSCGAKAICIDDYCFCNRI